MPSMCPTSTNRSTRKGRSSASGARSACSASGTPTCRRTELTGVDRSLRCGRLGRMELEERTIEQLPDRCQNCGATLTDAEKEPALEEGSALVLCTPCASEAETLPADTAE